MVATLRVMLDQVVAPTSPVLAEASRELARALIDGAPSGCVVEGIVPGGTDAESSVVAGLADVRRAGLPRRELATALQLGAPTGIGGGMIHAPTLFAPLVKHDRTHDGDQTVVTVWDLRAWETPDELSRLAVGWQKAMLKRAAKHADAIVAPTHSMAERLRSLAKLGDRVRVIAGAAPAGFVVPTDDIGRRREMDLPEGFVLLSGGTHASTGLATGFAGIAASGVDHPVVVIDVPEGQEPAVAEIAEAAGVPERRVHVRGSLDTADRAAVFGAALAFVAPASRTAFPWRVLDALTLGVPVLAADTAVHRDVIADGGELIDVTDAAAAGDAFGDALSRALGSTQAAERLAVMADDRGRAFSWGEAADKVWHLHAEL